MRKYEKSRQGKSTKQIGNFRKGFKQLPWKSFTAVGVESGESMNILFLGNENASSKRTLRTTDSERSNRTENCSEIVVGLWI